MDSDTFRSRLLKLLQKSRQAYRLYESMGRAPKGDAAEYTEMQANEWRNVNADLLKELSASLERPSQKEVVSRVFMLRERILAEFRMAEAEVNSRQKELVFAAEKGDFIRAALLSRRLAMMKARAQANQAAHHELDDVITQSHVSQQTILLGESDMVKEASRQVEMSASAPQPEEKEQPRLAPVIPLRKRQVSA